MCHTRTPQLVGRRVFLRIVDRETAGWGHVTFDDFTAEGRIDREATERRWVEVDARQARRRLDDAFSEELGYLLGRVAKIKRRSPAPSSPPRTGTPVQMAKLSV